MEKALPSIPAKRYFTIGEVSDLCGVKPYVLRYWEQEFTQLKPMKRRGNRRYYQHHEVLLIRRIRDLLYEQGFTISGARNRLIEAPAADVMAARDEPDGDAARVLDGAVDLDAMIEELEVEATAAVTAPAPLGASPALSLPQMRQELISIRGLLIV
ncbi:MAG TPA: MerR family transcriptional regulator [Burkholderiaceae bacterium]|nr:MerR family transcriptional regulator [Burkholderiaceae bacterium]